MAIMKVPISRFSSIGKRQETEKINDLLFLDFGEIQPIQTSTISRKTGFPEEIVERKIKDGLLTILKEGQIGNAYEISRKFFFLKRYMSSQEVRKAAEIGYSVVLEKGQIGASEDIRKTFHLDHAFVQKAAKAGYLSCLRDGHIGSVEEMAWKFGLSKDFLDSEEVRRAAEKGACNCLEKGWISNFSRMNKRFRFKRPFLEKAVWDAYISCLKRGESVSAKELRKRFRLKAGRKIERDIHEAVQKGYSLSMKEGRVEDAEAIGKESDLDKETMRSAIKRGYLASLGQGNCLVCEELVSKYPSHVKTISKNDLSRAARKGFIYSIECNKMDQAIYLKKKFHLGDDFMDSPVVRNPIKKYFTAVLRDGWTDEADKIRSAFGLSRKFVLDNAINAYMDCLKRGWIGDADNISERFSIPKNRVREASSEVAISELEEGRVCDWQTLTPSKKLPERMKRAIQKGYLSCLEKGKIGEAEKLAENYGLSSKERTSLVKKGFLSCLEKGWAMDVSNMIKGFFIDDDYLSSEEIMRYAQRGFKNCMMMGRLDDVLRMGNIFQFSDGFIESEELRELAMKRMSIELCNDRIGMAFKIRDMFLKDMGSKEIMSLSKEITAFFKELKSWNVFLYEKARIYPNLAISLCSYFGRSDELKELIADNHFLLDALDANPKYGDNLFLKYQDFDRLSKENISFLYSCKEKVLEKAKGRDMIDVRFRKAMQEKLSKYKNNKGNLKKMEEAGVSLGGWLNHDKEIRFSLEEEHQSPFFQEVSLLLETLDMETSRLGEALDSVISKEERYLKAKKTFPDSYYEAEKNVSMIKKKLRQEKDPGKKIVLKRGLLVQKELLEVHKKRTLGVMEKLSMARNVIETDRRKIAQERAFLVEAWKSGKNDYPVTRRNTIIKGVKRLKKDLDRASNLFSQEISRVLGEKKAISSTRLIKELSGPGSGMNNVLIGLREALTRGRDNLDLSGREMAITLWKRDPDIDLYQGNYCSCCISIESGSASDSKISAISDYLTDCGIQVVNVIDMKRRCPVIAAWCWTGKNKKTGSKVFIVDNIEADTDYTSRYHGIIAKKMEEYIQDYAQAAGFRREEIIQGIHNNDLELGFVKNKDRQGFEKIGNPNREDGYYLETENEMELT